ncbi:hypothetical protein, partial [Acetobacter estunensis]|uniref:hypothetical protein n=1 Tax=Acetobacter estunensis TaxID=104097 RepID=UPI001A7EFF9C
CSKRRLDAIAKTVNQIAKTQKLPAKHINQGFFDPSTFSTSSRPVAEKPFSVSATKPARTSDARVSLNPAVAFGGRPRRREGVAGFILI